jgi:hypothetical protein
MLKRKDTSVTTLALLVAIAPISGGLVASPFFAIPGGMMAQASKASSSLGLRSLASDRTTVTNRTEGNSRLVSGLLVSDLQDNRVAQEVAIASANSAEATNEADPGIPIWFWWLLPLALSGLLWWLLRKRAESSGVRSSQAAPVRPLSPAPSASRAVATGATRPASGANASAPSPAPTAAPGIGSGLVGGATAAAARSSLSSDYSNGGTASHRPDAIPEYQALYNRGMVLAESGLYEEAIASFDRAIEAKPDFFAAWASKGDALLSVDRPEEAIVSFDRAIELSAAATSASAGATGTALAATWAGKGNALANLGRAEEAIASFDQALEIEPTYAEAQASRNALIASLSTAAPYPSQADPALESVPSLADADSTDLVEPPLVETSPDSVAETPAEDTPVADIPTVETPAEDTPVADTFAEDIPVADTSAEDIPAVEVPAEDIPNIRTQVGGAVLAAGTTAWSAMSSDKMQSDVEAAKFDVGQTDEVESLAAVDEDLDDLPEGYGESRIVLMPRDPQWAYAYWDIPIEHKEELRRQGGSYLALRLYDVTDIDLNHQNPHSLQQFSCEEMARDWYLPIPVSDRDYIVEIGYTTNDDGWLMLARSAPTRIPPVYPSDWFEDQFLTISWDEDLRDKTFLTLTPPSQSGEPKSESTLYNTLFGLAQSAESMRVAGSLFGSMQQVPQQAISSYIFPSGAALWAMPTLSGIGMSGIGMSGAGFPASIPPIRPRKFWLVADAELIVYGATEPDATVTIDGLPIQLDPDGTFRFQMSFQDGMINYPIIAVAVDGEQSRSIHMEFERETPERNTNTKDEATDEWLE